VAAWLEALQATLKDMAGHGELPAQVFLCGGGAALPDVHRAARSHRWMQALPFARQPQVTTVQPGLQSNVVDLTHAAGSDAFVVPASLAAWLVQSLRPANSAPHRILKQVLHGMNLL
jgi:cell division protein FtsA